MTYTKEKPNLLPEWYLGAEKRCRSMDATDNSFGFASPTQCDVRVQLQTACSAFSAAIYYMEQGQHKESIAIFAEAFVLARELPTT